jgi:hypothetical protein
MNVYRQALTVCSCGIVGATLVVGGCGDVRIRTEMPHQLNISLQSGEVLGAPIIGAMPSQVDGLTAEQAFSCSISPTPEWVINNRKNLSRQVFVKMRPPGPICPKYTGSGGRDDRNNIPNDARD